jgi:sterol desaturase/sphingolipid hydroxylase (fatty acid hydroxylase superfamily)
MTTGFRFHPLENVVAVLSGTALIAATAMPAAGVFLFELLAQFQALGAHSNTSLPDRWARIVSCFFITPDLHAIHHSIDAADQRTNLGVVFPWWDRLFGTYREAPAGYGPDRFGLEEFPDHRALHVPYMLTTPFVTLPPPEPQSAPVPVAQSRRA